MSDLLIRNIPPDLKLDLVHSAKENGRSLSAEAVERLRAAATPARRRTLKLRFGRADSATTWRRDEIYADEGP